MIHAEGVVGGFNQVEEDALFLWGVPQVVTDDMPLILEEARELRRLTNEVLAEDWKTADGHEVVDDSDRADSQYREIRLSVIEKQFKKLVSQ